MRGCVASPVAGHPDDLLAVELVLVELVAAVVLDDAVLHAREERRQAVVVVLRPALERVVVALGALQADAEEHLGRRLGAAVAGRGGRGSSWPPGGL